MKPSLKTIAYTLTVGVLFLAGIGIKLAQRLPATTHATTEQQALFQELVVQAEGLQSTVEPIDGRLLTETAQPGEPLNPGNDLKRGSFLNTASIQPFVKPDQEQVVNNARVSISTITRKDTRAFVNLCMEIEGNQEKLDFGTVYVDYPGGRTDSFFVHEAEGSNPNERCLTLEFAGIPPDVPSRDWKLTMEWLGFAVPDEGTECSAYLRRAAARDLLKQQGIQFTCNPVSGQPEIRITNKPDALTEAQAVEIVNQAVTGVISGPWVFNPVVK